MKRKIDSNSTFLIDHLSLIESHKTVITYVEKFPVGTASTGVAAGLRIHLLQAGPSSSS